MTTNPDPPDDGLFKSGDTADYLRFEEAPQVYLSPTQRARVWTEGWAAKSLYCANCGSDELQRFSANKPVADLFCADCGETFELKSKRGPFGKRIVDGAYETMIQRLRSGDNPNLILLNYDLASFGVTDAVLVPKHFFVEEIVERRPPLASTARRAGWVGCNIRLDLIPAAGRISFVANRTPRPKLEVQTRWRETFFLREAGGVARGWLVEVLRIVEDLRKDRFSLSDVYEREASLQAVYPGNQNIRPKIRQQLQVLRDHGLVRFLGNGQYELVRSRTGNL
ncbi:MAG: restriction endonuclease [Phenylobacterium sp.]|uniref:DpnI domain-containing protein n=1 Tax=Phenylobacterium sp. TaxID=1871053 RepID=UPI00183255D0|nr:DpnI domain-containing protein [Phenylobacterium sp.]MBA4792097.1 restriction endonuclease [Phenylobacterium sp.]